MKYIPPGHIPSDLATIGAKPLQTPSVISVGLITWGTMLLEGVLVVCAAAIAETVYIESYLAVSPGLAFYMTLSMVGAVSVMLTFRLMKLYEPYNLLRDRTDLSQVCVGILIAFALVLFQLFALHTTEVYSRIWLALWFGLTMVLVSASRVAERTVLRKWLQQGRLNRRIALFGSKEMLDPLVGRVARSEVESVIVARFEVPAGDEGQERWNEALVDLLDLAQSGRCDQIVVALPLIEHAQIGKVARVLRILPIDVLLITHLPDDAVGANWSEIAGLPALRLHTAPLSENELLLKTVFDRIVAAVALVLLAPLFLMIACAIKLDSRGPVFFLQRRNGYNHCIFRVFKFRTMTVLEDGDDIKQVKAGDTRVTRVGRVLRGSSLDELPQLINVLKGEMSLVGPRPHALAHNAYYAKMWAEYAMRHRVKPGITGLAQSVGYRGETSNPEDMRKRVELDVEYARNWSMWGDIKIMLRTVGVLLRQRAH